MPDISSHFGAGRQFALRLTEWKDFPPPVMVVKERVGSGEQDVEGAASTFERRRRGNLADRGHLSGEPQRRCLPIVRGIVSGVRDDGGAPLELQRYMTREGLKLRLNLPLDEDTEAKLALICRLQERITDLDRVELVARRVAALTREEAAYWLSRTTGFGADANCWALSGRRIQLPPDPPVRLEGELLGWLSRADRALGRLDGATETLPNPDLFVFMYVRKEAVLSSQIEGTQASLLDVLEVEAKLKTENPFDVEEVINYVHAMNHGLGRLAALPVSLRLVREVHEQFLAGVRGGHRNPGEFRRVQNHIGPPNCPIEKATFVPPTPNQALDALADLERFVHAQDDLPVLVRVGLIHAQFETIHPFLDGNGRVGRLLITLLLCERDILRRPLLYLSCYFKRNRTEYYDRLQRIRDRGDWEGWLTFFFRGVFEVAQEATATARQIVRIREEDRERIMAELGRSAAGALRVHESLFQQPIVSVQDAQELTGLSYANANRLMAQLENIQLLREITGHKRNRRFAYQAYLNLFTNDQLTAPRTGDAVESQTRTE